MDAFRAMAAGCGGLVHHDGTGPSACTAPPTAAGLRVYAQRRLAVWLGFACNSHAHQLVAPRPLLDRDREVLRRRREREATLLAGRAWNGEEEGPLARGRDAARLVARAEAWAKRHPLQQ